MPCKEASGGYLDRMFQIVSGNVSKKDLKKTFLHVCATHMMNLNKNKYSKEVQQRSGARQSSSFCSEIFWPLHQLCIIKRYNRSGQKWNNYHEKSVHSRGSTTCSQDCRGK